MTKISRAIDTRSNLCTVGGVEKRPPAYNNRLFIMRVHGKFINITGHVMDPERTLRLWIRAHWIRSKCCGYIPICQSSIG